MGLLQNGNSGLCSGEKSLEYDWEDRKEFAHQGTDNFLEFAISVANDDDVVNIHVFV